MRLILLTIWAIICVIAGDWVLRKGVAFQLKGIRRRGIWLQILAAVITIGLPILAAFVVK